jgi:predicted metalloprotease
MRGRGGLGGGIPIGVGGGGAAGLILLLLVVLLNGGLPGGGSSGGPLDPFPTVASPQAQPGEPQTCDNQTEFVYFVTNDVQNTWEDIFKRAGETYPRTTLRLFSDQISTGCGVASSATGPFYCPPDEHVYLDMTFFQELKNRFGAAGDFAQAYVIAHEFGHHVQHSLGIDEQVKSREDGIKLELQADCLAGVWGHSAAQRKLLEPGDLQEGLAAAASVGDDRIQEKTQGRVDPESWTHGSAAQRQKWFKVGFDSGDPTACDTFKT